MNKPKDKIEERAKYVKERVNNARHATQEIKRLARELFLDVRTIERDLKRD